MRNLPINIAKDYANAFSEVCQSRQPPSLLRRLRSWACRRRAYRRDRELFNYYLGLDDYILDDIGFTREDVLWASSLPVSESASRQLLERTESRKKALQNYIAQSRSEL